MSLQLYYGNVYKYLDDNNDVQIGIYISDTNISKKICMVPLKNKIENTEFYEISVLKKVAYPQECFELNRNKIISPLMIKGKIAKTTYKEYLFISNIVISKLTEKILNTYKSYLKKRFNNTTQDEYALTEDYYKYLTWFEHKSNLEFNKSIKRNPEILKYGIYYVEIGENIGSELRKLRPAIIFKRIRANIPNDSSYIVIPITSKHTASRYRFNTPILVNGKINYARINDMRRVSVKRLVSPLYKSGTDEICVLSDEEITNLLQDFEDYFLK